MRKVYQFFIIYTLILLSVFSATAQITISSTDMPSSSSIYNVSIGQAFIGMDETLTGTGYSWDYSQLTYTSQTQDTFVSILSTGLYAATFFGSSFALKSNTPSVTLGPLTINYDYDFFKKATSSYVLTGFGASFNGFPLGVPNNPKDTLYRFPLHYNDNGSCSSAFSATVPTLGYYGGNKTRTDTVDGWGTLTTPYGSFSVLRVKSVIHETDSIHYDALNVGFTFPRPVVVEYKWLGANQGIPLLQINTSAGIVTQIFYRDSVRTTPLAVAPVKKSEIDFNVFPNPSTGKMFIELNLEKEAMLAADVYSITGEKVISHSFGKKNSGTQFLLLDLSDDRVSSGNYFLELSVDGRITRKQLVVNK